nr:DNA-directed RNA polymerase II subunit RPB1-like [Pelodiscus sinensis]XP_025038711.1 DNA-directed RNA polymerase II subunit RPB1-like [Pelodiscus sinensis]XP_025038712.1 DNA-directed RNA polymerase II subunit RPB1-like [Pelodiscus sinensis]|eukprot:XP_025038710.1 DNA-directed RNA polymerase II subunit RPB1-like [Pelodiscus sinensis]
MFLSFGSLAFLPLHNTQTNMSPPAPFSIHGSIGPPFCSLQHPPAHPDMRPIPPHPPYVGPLSSLLASFPTHTPSSHTPVSPGLQPSSLPSSFLPNPHTLLAHPYLARSATFQPPFFLPSQPTHPPRTPLSRQVCVLPASLLPSFPTHTPSSHTPLSPGLRPTSLPSSFLSSQPTHPPHTPLSRQVCVLPASLLPSFPTHTPSSHTPLSPGLHPTSLPSSFLPNPHTPVSPGPGPVSLSYSFIRALKLHSYPLTPPPSQHFQPAISFPNLVSAPVIPLFLGSLNPQPSPVPIIVPHELAELALPANLGPSNTPPCSSPSLEPLNPPNSQCPWDP